jgi:hypothetical protein
MCDGITHFLLLSASFCFLLSAFRFLLPTYLPTCFLLPSFLLPTYLPPTKDRLDQSNLLFLLTTEKPDRILRNQKEDPLSVSSFLIRLPA